MIEYVVPANIDDRILARGAALLGEGGLLALPTDTSWSIVCSLRGREGIKKLRRLSGERDERHFTLLCGDISQFGEFCGMDNTRFRIIKRLSPGPYVFILRTLSGTDKALGLRRRELGVRIPNHPVPLGLIKTLNQPLYSVTAKRGMTAAGEAAGYADNPPDPKPSGPEKAAADTELPPIPEEQLFEGGWELEAVPELAMILDPGEDQKRIFSTILDMTGDEVLQIRRGAGPWPV
ncbi:MAG: Sua5/YciO/YrdC/YwlC family protein [Spirochaetaceae bacterium]|jgi:tRNA threonylcarbamoyl adenosine modification protein (Sua5/YciO/YrdC/YwlC family)|nr:Sua5/YciO/YrdC/YwlC family protein [Spirochaetaceae bacterium]